MRLSSWVVCTRVERDRAISTIAMLPGRWTEGSRKAMERAIRGLDCESRSLLQGSGPADAWAVRTTAVRRNAKTRSLAGSLPLWVITGDPK